MQKLNNLIVDLQIQYKHLRQAAYNLNRDPDSKRWRDESTNCLHRLGSLIDQIDHAYKIQEQNLLDASEQEVNAKIEWLEEMGHDVDAGHLRVWRLYAQAEILSRFREIQEDPGKDDAFHHAAQEALDEMLRSSTERPENQSDTFSGGNIQPKITNGADPKHSGQNGESPCE